MAKVEEDFREMTELGANVVRVHLQFGKFMRSADNRTEALDRLAKLLALAETATVPRPDRAGLLPQEGRAGVVRHAR